MTVEINLITMATPYVVQCHEMKGNNNIGKNKQG